MQPSSREVAKGGRHLLLGLEGLCLGSVQSISVCFRLEWWFGASSGLLKKRKPRKKPKAFLNLRNFLNGRLIKTRSFHHKVVVSTK